MKSINFIVIFILSLLAAPSIYAVTEKEMEEARAITAKEYLRYANDGSGYLDEFSVSSMAELKGKLKEKEKENIKTFEAIKIPSDFASWDKDKLVEYWGITFFKSPGLLEKGKIAKQRVINKLKKMTIDPPVQNELISQNEETKPKETQTTQQVSSISQVDASSEPVQDVTPPQNIEEQNTEISTTPEKKQHSGTWVYVVILCILVAVVAWLLVYAVNAMKSSQSTNSAQKRDNSLKTDKEKEPELITETAEDEMRARFAESLRKKNEEIERLRNELDQQQKLSFQSEDYLKKHQMQLSAVQKENSLLKEEIESLKEKLSAETDRKNQEAIIRETTTSHTTSYVPNTDNRRPTRTIYLGRANNNGIFLRADREFIPGHSIFILTTTDGVSGSFSVIESTEVTDMAILSPIEVLGNACTGQHLRDTSGVTAIQTEQSGTAIFEAGCWRVVRKAKIEYK